MPWYFISVNNSITNIAADSDIVNCFDWIFDEFIFFFFWGMVLFDMFVQKVKGTKWNRMTVWTQKYQVILGILHIYWIIIWKKKEIEGIQIRDLYIAIKLGPGDWPSFTESWQSFGQAVQIIFQWEENFSKDRKYIFLNPDKELKF